MEKENKSDDTHFANFFLSTENGVTGVVHISSRKPGPVVGITVCTHGNEPSGLYALTYLLDTLDIKKNLMKGELYLVINNLEAAKKSLRFIDADMNRLPTDLMTGNYNGYEEQRARELLPIWDTFDVGLDIHSTSTDAPPMIFQIGSRFHHKLLKGVPIKRVVTNIDTVQRGRAACTFYGRGNAQVFAIETGQHTSQTAISCARASVEAVLQNLNMLSGETSDIETHEEYRVVGSIILPDESYKTPADGFPNFGSIKKGTLIARGNGPDIVMPFDGHTIMHNGEKRPTDPFNETLFITEPVRRW